MIKIENLVFSYPHRTKRLSIEKLEINENLTLFLGKSGSFKTTLAKIISGNLKAKKGKIKVLSSVFYLNQNFTLVPNFTARENFIEAGLDGYEYYAKRLGVDFLLDYDVSSLSMGQKARLNFIFALCQNKDLMILDEPSRNVDPENIKVMEELVYELRDSKKFIIISHDSFCLDQAEAIVRFDDHTVSKERRSPTAKVYSNENFTATKDPKKHTPKFFLDKVFISIMLFLTFIITLTSTLLFHDLDSPGSYEDSVYVFNVEEEYKDYEDIPFKYIPDVKLDFSLYNGNIPSLIQEQANIKFSSINISFSDSVSRGYFSINEDYSIFFANNHNITNINNYSDYENTYVEFSTLAGIKIFPFAMCEELPSKTITLNTSDYIDLVLAFINSIDITTLNTLANDEVIVTNGLLSTISYSNKEYKIGDYITISSGTYKIKEIIDSNQVSIQLNSEAINNLIFNFALKEDKLYLPSYYGDTITDVKSILGESISDPLVNEPSILNNKNIKVLISIEVILLLFFIIYGVFSRLDSHQKSLRCFYHYSNLSFFRYLIRSVSKKRIAFLPLVLLIATLCSLAILFMTGNLSIIVALSLLLSLTIYFCSFYLAFVVEEGIVFLSQRPN